jgi:diaminopimelate decarboxylase
VNLPDPYQYTEGELCCEGVRLEQIAQEVGTPCYVYSRSAIQSSFRLLIESFASVDPLIFYAVKANSNLSILKILKELGSSFDIVSGGEFFRLDQIGVSPNRMIFSGVGKTEDELALAVEHSIYCLVIESLFELVQLSELCRKRGKQCRISFRFNPDIDAGTHPYISTGLAQHKFGLDTAAVKAATEILRDNPLIKLVGIGSHIGSQVLDVQPYMDAFEKVIQLAEKLRSMGHAIDHVDLGGGFGIPYREEGVPDFDTLAAFLAERCSDYRIVMEPGRFIVGKAGILLTSILGAKTNHEKSFYIVDGGMNDLIRPALYNAYHNVLPVSEGGSSEIIADVVGPVCESSDFFAKERTLPELLPGELLAVMDTGAYGFVASSNYNSRPKVAEVLVDNISFHIIRSRETWEDMIRHEET